MKKIIFSAMFVAALVMLVSCGSKKEVKTTEETIDFPSNDQTFETVTYTSDEGSTDWKTL